MLHKKQTSAQSRLYGYTKPQISETTNSSQGQNIDPNKPVSRPVEKKRKYGSFQESRIVSPNPLKKDNTSIPTTLSASQPPVDTSRASGRVVLATNSRTIQSTSIPQSKVPNAPVHRVPRRPLTVPTQRKTQEAQVKPIATRSTNSYRSTVAKSNSEGVEIEDLNLALGNLENLIAGLKDKMMPVAALEPLQPISRDHSITIVPETHTGDHTNQELYNYREDQFRQLTIQKQELQQKYFLENKTSESRSIFLQSQYESDIITYSNECAEIDQMTTTLNELDKQQIRLDNDFEALKKKYEEDYKQLCLQMDQEYLQAKEQSDNLILIKQKEIQSAQLTIDQNENEIETLENDLSSLKTEIRLTEEKIILDETKRKQLHENIQELKGNIRVICRVRPRLGTETVEDVSYSFPDSNQEVLIEVSGLKDITGRRIESKQTHPWKFDRVFGPNSNQKEVFEEISHLVQSSLDGYNCCIFAYGQTGSGKTYTMEGAEDLENEETRGMIYRAIQQVFESSEKLKLQGWSYEMKASFFEIYNDTIRDLFNNQKQKHLEPKLDSNNKTFIPDLKIVNVNTPTRLFELLKRASPNRATAETQMNKRSSRSHSIFQLYIEGNNSITKESVLGLLNFIDLAGSEKLESSGVKGAQAKETIFINTSLTALKDVFTALARNERHIPVRNSKLTFVLQNSLSGNSKTMMFVNISPAAENLPESLNSLRFATNVNTCNLGTAKKTSKITFNCT